VEGARGTETPEQAVGLAEPGTIQNAPLPLPPYWADPTPLYYFERWPLQELSGLAKGRIKAKLSKIHADILENKAGERPEIDGWRRAYNVFASAFEAANLLTKDLIRKNIPEMVADAGTSGRWPLGRFSSIKPSGDRSQPLGQEFYHSGRIQLFFKYIEGRIVEWSGKLDLQHSKEDGDAQRRPELGDESGTLTSGESKSQEAQGAPVPQAGGRTSPEQASKAEPDLTRKQQQRVAEAGKKLDEAFEVQELQHRTGSAPEAIEVDEHAGVGFGSVNREERLQSFIAAHHGTTLADIKYSARVYTSDFQDWRGGHVKQESVMSKRIEDVLSGATQLKKKPRKRRPD
jgi:hypothetical protein